MDSLPGDCGGTCAACGEQFSGPHRAKCNTCEGALCERCFGAHSRTPALPSLRGHDYEASPFERDRAALLGQLGLSRPAKVCAVHGKQLAFVCTSHDATAASASATAQEIIPKVLCADCIDEHKSHTLSSIARQARIARERLQQATARRDQGQHPIALIRARILRTEAALEALPHQAAAALEHAAAARDAVVAAALERFRILESTINVAAADHEATLAADLRASNAALERGVVLIANMQQAAVSFDDIDAITYCGVLTDEVHAMDIVAARVVKAPETLPCVILAMGSSLEDVITAVRQLGVVALSPALADAAAVTHASFPLLEASARADAENYRARLSAAEGHLEASRSELEAERAARVNDAAQAERATAEATRLATAHQAAIDALDRRVRAAEAALGVEVTAKAKAERRAGTAEAKMAASDRRAEVADGRAAAAEAAKAMAEKRAASAEAAATKAVRAAAAAAASGGGAASGAAVARPIVSPKGSHVEVRCPLFTCM